MRLQELHDRSPLVDVTGLAVDPDLHGILSVRAADPRPTAPRLVDSVSEGASRISRLRSTQNSRDDGNSPRPGCDDGAGVRGVDASDREDRQGDRCEGTEHAQPQHGPAGMGAARENRAQLEVVHVFRGGALGLIDPVDGSPNDKGPAERGSCAVCGEPIGRQMNTIRARRESNVCATIDGQARPIADRLSQGNGQGQQLPRGQVLFSELNHCHPAGDRVGHRFREASAPGQATVGDQADDRGRKQNALSTWRCLKQTPRPRPGRPPGYRRTPSSGLLAAA